MLIIVMSKVRLIICRGENLIQRCSWLSIIPPQHDNTMGNWSEKEREIPRRRPQWDNNISRLLSTTSNYNIIIDVSVTKAMMRKSSIDGRSNMHFSEGSGMKCVCLGTCRHIMVILIDCFFQLSPASTKMA